MMMLPATTKTIDPVGSYESYIEFLQAIARTIQRYPNSAIQVHQILSSPQYVVRSAWETKRNEWMDIELALNTL